MELILGTDLNGTRLDLYGDTDVTVDYTIFPISNITERTVSYTNEFEIPRTPLNESLIDPIINGVYKYDVILLGDSIKMYGSMFVETTRINIIEENYNVMIVDLIKEKLDLLNDSLDKIVDDTSESFYWLFGSEPRLDTVSVDCSFYSVTPSTVYHVVPISSVTNNSFSELKIPSGAIETLAGAFFGKPSEAIVLTISGEVDITDFRTSVTGGGVVEFAFVTTDDDNILPSYHSIYRETLADNELDSFSFSVSKSLGADEFLLLQVSYNGTNLDIESEFTVTAVPTFEYTAPNDTTANSFFISTANFNGDKYSNWDSNYPVYAEKYLTDITQCLWSWRYDTFINKCMNYAGVDFDLLTGYSGVTDDINFGELSVNINAPFVGSIDRSMYMSINEDAEIQSGYTDSCRQIEFSDTATSVIGMTDTLYDISLSGEITVRLKLGDVAEIPEEDGWWRFESEDSFVRVGIALYDAPYGSDSRNMISVIELGDVGSDFVDDGDGGKIATTNITGISTELLSDFELLATNYASFGYILIIKEATFVRLYWDYDIINEYETYYNGTYGVGSTLFNQYTSFDAEIISTTDLDVVFDWKKSIHPVSEKAGVGGDYWDNVDIISPELSLQEVDSSMSDVINDILNRYNLGVWEDSDNIIHISRFDDRYGDSIDLSYKLLNEDTSITFSNDIIKTFSYKNKSNDNKTTKLKTDKGEEFTLGDVVEYEVNENGAVEETINLSSFPSEINFYGDNVESGFNQNMINAYSIEQLGGSYNEQIHIDGVGISHGFFTPNDEDIRQAYVDDVEYTEDGDLIERIEVQYKLGGANYVSGTLPNKYPDISSSKDDKTILLGDEDGVINNNSISRNFKIDEYGELYFKQTYNISTYLTDSEINDIRNGKIIVINGDEYLPISINGVSFNSDGGSYVTIVSVYKETYTPPLSGGDFNSDFNSDFNNN